MITAKRRRREEGGGTGEGGHIVVSFARIYMVSQHESFSFEAAAAKRAEERSRAAPAGVHGSSLRAVCDRACLRCVWGLGFFLFCAHVPEGELMKMRKSSYFCACPPIIYGT